jgi:hypothetical protein
MGLSAIITTTDLSNVSSTFSDFSGTLKNALLPQACSVADQYVGWSMDSASAVEYYDGSQSVYLNLKRRPVTTLTEVRRDTSGGYGQVPSTFGASTILTLGTDFLCDYAKGILTLTLSTRGTDWYSRGYPFPVASAYYGRGLTANYIPASWGQIPGQIKATYTAGYTAGTLPSEVITAVAQIAVQMSKLNNTGGQMSTSVSYIDVSDGLTTQTVLDQMRGGIPVLGSARQILDNYRAPVIGTTWVLR